MTAVKAKTPVADATTQIEDAVAVSKDTIENVVKASADAASKGYEKAVAVTKEQVDVAVKAGTAAFRGYEDVIQFNKETVEALLQSGTVFARGFQDLSKNMLNLAQASFDESVAASKAITGVKSLKELIDLQSGYAKSNFDKIVAEGSKLSEFSAKVTEEAIGPLNSRFNAAVERLIKPAA